MVVSGTAYEGRRYGAANKWKYSALHALLLYMAEPSRLARLVSLMVGRSSSLQHRQMKLEGQLQATS
jgi:hypothetical protein